MYLLYSIFLFFSFFFYIPLYFFRWKILNGESLYLKERMGIHLRHEEHPRKSVWIHAASVGEVLSLQNLILVLKERHPETCIYFSSLTNTGLRVAQEKLLGVDKIFFFPIDFRKVVRKFFRVLKPTLFVLAESEFWPHLLREAKRQTQGILLINGRISPRSFRRYYRFRFFFEKIIKNIDFFMVQTAREKESLEKLGIHSDSIQVTGNLKTEIVLPTFTEDEISERKANLNIPKGHTVVLAGSTHRGEEEKLMKAFADARNKKDEIVLVLAPRHPERAGEIIRHMKAYPFSVIRRSELQPDRKWDVLILDTLGELSRLYALCDAAFIGGSLVPWGGQNLLEPAFYGKPIFFGPHMENFQELADRFVNEDAARIVHTVEDLASLFISPDQEKVSAMGRKGREILETFQGVTDRTYEKIAAYLKLT